MILIRGGGPQMEARTTCKEILPLNFAAKAEKFCSTRAQVLAALTLNLLSRKLFKKCLIQMYKYPTNP